MTARGGLAPCKSKMPSITDLHSSATIFSGSGQTPSRYNERNSVPKGNIMPKKYRAAVIGATGKGSYGHGLDTAFSRLDRVELIAVADENPAGLRMAGKRLNVDRLYSDYRDMLAKEKPDIVSIGPRWIDERAAMVEAAASAGCHIYCEKPFSGNLVDADRMMAAVNKADVKIAVAHQFRGMPPLRKAIKDLKAGKYGRLLRLRARPKDDHRGGGEELVVHGTHLFDMMIAFVGPPRWVSGHVAVGSRDATLQDTCQGTEPVGPIAGDSIAATIGFDHGVHGFFDSTANLDRNGRFLYGMMLECEKATLHIRRLGDVYVYPAPQVLPELPDLEWEKIWIEDWHFTPEHKPADLRDWLHRGNKVLVEELIAAVETGREPTASGESARLVLEIVQGVYASHLSGGRRLSIPLKDRRHPLGG